MLKRLLKWRPFGARALPATAEDCKERGNAHMRKGEFAAAAACYRQAIDLRPDYAEARNNLGLALLQQGESDAALAAFEQALALKPDLAQAHLNRGNVLRARGRIDDAMASFHAAIAANPELPEAHNNLGAALQAQGRAADALACYQTAIRFRPSFAEAHYNLGDLLLDQGQLEDARTCFERAIALQPDFADAHNSLGIVERDLGRLDQASACFEHAVALRPAFPAAHTNQGTLALDRGDRATAYDCFRHALSIDPGYADAHSNLLFAAQYDPAYTAKRLHAEHMEFGQRFEAPLRSRWPSARPSPAAGRRLRVGFVSGDLRTHPVGYFMENVLANLDRQVVEVVLYPTLSRSDALTERLRALDVAWHPLFGLSDDDAARRIADDRIDILVDLSGHTAGNRLLVFARKPAPVQVSWLYFSTTGLRAMDYLLCDRHVVPADEAHHFVEKPWYLPDSYLCFTPPKDDVPIGQPPILCNGYVTFGCFNNIVKINDAVVGLWARILLSIPASRLLLKAGQLKDPSMQQAMRSRFAAHGVAPDRLLLEGPSSRLDYLSGYNRIDITLDPFPFPGGTTTVESLWMSVPVLTRRGDRFIAHAGESILHTVDLPDWIAADDDDYLAKAQHFANDPQCLARIRSGLRAQFLSSPLCDARRFASNLEEAFLGMWAECVSIHSPGGRTANFASEAEARKNEGNEHLMKGELDEAFRCYEEAVFIHPEYAEAHNNLGLVCQRLDRFADAEQHLLRALSLKPDLANAHYNLANVVRSQGRPQEAIEHYRNALRFAPDMTSAHLDLSSALCECGRTKDAEHLLSGAIAENPHDAALHSSLGCLLQKENRLAKAETCFRNALALGASALLHCHLGHVLQEQNKLADAGAHYRQAIALDPAYIEAHNNLGAVLQAQGKIAEAIECFKQVLSLKPGFEPTLHNLGLAELADGRLADGWKHYGRRFFPGNIIVKREFPHPYWAGESLADRSLLVWCEQGIGDEILFANMFPDIIARAGRCVIECAPKLAPLFARSFPGAAVVPRTNPPHPATLDGIDFQVAAADLAQWLRPTLESFPRHEGFLVPDPARVAYWRARLATLGPGLKVGFCWRSSVVNNLRRLHYSQLDQWGPIFGTPNTHFVNLQYDQCTDELNAARRRFGVVLHDFAEVDLFNDLDEATALTKALDVVITAATAASGLAAAAGVPTWEMGYGTTWVNLGANHVPWFPSQRLYLRAWNQPWEDIIAAIAAELKVSVGRQQA